MATDLNKERWIDEVLATTAGMERATPPSAMYEKVMARMNQPKAVAGVSLPLKQWIAAAVLLAVVNIASIAHFAKNNGRDRGGHPLAAQVVNETVYSY